jgi:hypothetical protein
MKDLFQVYRLPVEMFASEKRLLAHFFLHLLLAQKLMINLIGIAIAAHYIIYSLRYLPNFQIYKCIQKPSVFPTNASMSSIPVLSSLLSNYAYPKKSLVGRNLKS